MIPPWPSGEGPAWTDPPIPLPYHLRPTDLLRADEPWIRSLYLDGPDPAVVPAPAAMPSPGPSRPGGPPVAAGATQESHQEGRSGLGVRTPAAAAVSGERPQLEKRGPVPPTSQVRGGSRSSRSDRLPPVSTDRPPASIDAIPQRIRKWVVVAPSGCWVWHGEMAKDGYGRFREPRPARRWVSVHRWSYKHFVGPIPAGLQIDHLCRNRRCLRPDHLEPVTPHENVRRSDAGRLEASRTHCPQGHPYDAANTYVPRRGGRECRACWPIRKRRWLDRQKADTKTSRGRE